ncbi:MAG: GNAT family N-acetyltransferase [Hyphomicrobiales bacterium]|nr:GNAT family N-acetyltransferase [Hyphomicrobiales bacterium]MCP5371779.1 GNAT family N-acetyltransferase [Hyphomicrobiales bacterium]
MSPRLKGFEVRLAESDREIDAAQALRYQVFYEEMSARPSREMARRRRDFDDFDAICDHLIVIDKERSNGVPCVVGTYRLLRRSVATRHGGFYSAQEYDLAPLLTLPGESVELGRSCVAADYRTRGVMQVLWGGLAQYIDTHGIEVMFGCASFPGTEPEDRAEGLSYLYDRHLAPAPMRPRALDHHYVNMRRSDIAARDERDLLQLLPPLIKGYLRVGGYVGDGAVIDHQFDTTDVCIIVQTERVTEKYLRHYRASGKS